MSCYLVKVKIHSTVSISTISISTRTSRSLPLVLNEGRVYSKLSIYRSPLESSQSRRKIVSTIVALTGISEGKLCNHLPCFRNSSPIHNPHNNVRHSGYIQAPFASHDLGYHDSINPDSSGLTIFVIRHMNLLRYLKVKDVQEVRPNHWWVLPLETISTSWFGKRKTTSESN